ncbi:fimbrial protein, partial [Salmonella enterica]|uniref:F4 family fimbrial subunit n=1 Tax=Salmonella enterica TaxID=28901 RepID=UPI003CF8B348
MKKTLIALAVAASAAVSGSAMAWTPNGTGGNVELGGTLAPQEKVTPWEVQVGAAKNDLNGQIQKGMTSAKISSADAIPVLGIRTIDKTPFKGTSGISPVINYGGVVDLDKFENSVAPLTLEVKNSKDDTKIGTLKTKIFAQARTSMTGAYNGQFWNYSAQLGQGFWGGLPKSMDKVSRVSRVNDLMPEVAQNYITQDAIDRGVSFATFAGVNSLHSAYYFSAIEPNTAIDITLDTPAEADAIVWKASL